MEVKTTKITLSHLKHVKVLLILILFFGTISCEKMEFKRDISGLWQCEGVGGGVVGGAWYPTNSFSHLRIKRNNHYSLYNRDTLKASGEYIIMDPEYQDPRFFEKFSILFKNSTMVEISFPLNKELNLNIINNDTLIFGERYISDALQYYFVRK